MARNEDGEFELVVGTRQLLTLVFILMVLFGVVFSMGYFVGRSSLTEGPPASAAAQRPTAEQPPGASAPFEQGGGRSGSGSAVSPLGSLATQAPGRAATTPSGSTAAAASPDESGPPPTPPVTPAETRTPPGSPAAAPAANQLAVPEPAPGQTFLQVAAVRRPEAELIVEVLKKKGFPALIAPVPGDSLFRALVGPLPDSAALAKTKADLEQAGFRSITRKY